MPLTLKGGRDTKRKITSLVARTVAFIMMAETVIFGNGMLNYAGAAEETGEAFLCGGAIQAADLEPITCSVGEEVKLDPEYHLKGCKVKTDKKTAVVKKKGKDLYLLPLKANDSLKLNYSAHDSGVHGTQIFKWSQTVKIIDTSFLNADKVTMGAGKSFTLKMSSSLNGFNASDVTYKSSKKKVAKVDKKSGVVTANKDGTTEITVTYKRKFPVTGAKKKIIKKCTVVVSGSGDPVPEGGGSVSDNNGGGNGGSGGENGGSGDNGGGNGGNGGSGDNGGGNGGSSEEVTTPGGNGSTGLSETTANLKFVGDSKDIYLYDGNGNKLAFSSYGHVFSGLSEADCITVEKTSDGQGIRVSALNNGTATYYVEANGVRYSGTVTCVIGDGNIHLTESHLYLKKDGLHDAKDIWLMDGNGNVISRDDFNSYVFTKAAYSEYDCITLTDAGDGKGMTATAITVGEGNINVNYNGTCYSALVTVLSGSGGNEGGEGGNGEGGNLEPGEDGYIDIGPMTVYYDAARGTDTYLRILFDGETNGNEFDIVDNWKAKGEETFSFALESSNDFPGLYVPKISPKQDTMTITGEYKGQKYRFTANIMSGGTQGTLNVVYPTFTKFNPSTGVWQKVEETCELGHVNAYRFAYDDPDYEGGIQYADSEFAVSIDGSYTNGVWTFYHLHDKELKGPDYNTFVEQYLYSDSIGGAAAYEVWADGVLFRFTVNAVKTFEYEKRYTMVRIHTRDKSWDDPEYSSSWINPGG